MGAPNVKMQTAIGFFILAGIVITMLMVVYMTGGVSLGRNAYFVKVEIDNIGELKVGAPVKYNGVSIGKVKTIAIKDEAVEIVAGINAQYDLHRDTAAHIATSGLVGDAFLEFTRGTRGSYLPKVHDIENAPEVKGVSQSGMGDMMLQLQKIGGEVEELVNNLNKLIGKESFRDDIEQSVSNVNDVTIELKSMLASFSANLGKIDTAINNIVKITDEAQTMMTTIDDFVGKTIGDPALAKDLMDAVCHVNSVTKMLDENKENIADTIKHVGAATGSIAGITREIKPDRGILRLLSDEQAGNEVMSVISSIQRVARNLATVGLSDLIADKFIGDKIAERWLNGRGNCSAEQMAREWKSWMSQQRSYAETLSGGSPMLPIYSYPNYPTVTTTPPNENYEAFYEGYATPSVTVSNAPVGIIKTIPATPRVSPPAPIKKPHPLSSLYEK